MPDMGSKVTRPPSLVGETPYLSIVNSIQLDLEIDRLKSEGARGQLVVLPAGLGGTIVLPVTPLRIVGHYHPNFPSGIVSSDLHCHRLVGHFDILAIE